MNEEPIRPTADQVAPETPAPADAQPALVADAPAETAVVAPAVAPTATPEADPAPEPAPMDPAPEPPSPAEAPAPASVPAASPVEAPTPADEPKQPAEQLALTPELRAELVYAQADPADASAPRLVRLHVCRERCDLGNFHIRIPEGYLEVEEFSDGSFALR